MADITGGVKVNFGNDSAADGTSTEGYNADVEANSELKKDYYEKQTALIKENLAMNLAMDTLKMVVSVANKGSSIAKDAFTG
jgi:hypothetical protein